MPNGQDVIIIGGGHAGCEAALAAARLGASVLLFTLSMDAIAAMPCNPSVGGTSKGHLVREVDALGGEMARNIDRTYLQSRMLNRSKGPAVHSLRAQADKAAYAAAMRRVLDNAPNVRLRQANVTELLIEGGRAAGVVTAAGTAYRARAVVLCLGTYLNARCLCGDVVTMSGPNGMMRSTGLAGCLRRLGVRMYRFKTGTPARIARRGVDFARMERQDGDEPPTPFSFGNTAEGIAREQLPCWLTYTNEETHAVIRRNIHRSPMFSGLIEGTGARYCPSIEDKVTRFADKERHQIFLEPEGEDSAELYCGGASTSLPEDAQEAFYRTIPGLERAEILRSGYAIEYDCLDATQLSAALEFKAVPGLFSAGQFNGSSGYEEAAAQGLIAGANAALSVLNRPYFTPDRSEAYIGVLIDDLTVKGVTEPYRMMTARAEYRLLLRQDNADLRLTAKGHGLGLVSAAQAERAARKQALLDAELRRLDKARLTELIRRPELSYERLAGKDVGRPNLPADVIEQVNIAIKYEGYIQKQLRQVAEFKRLEERALPDLDYHAVPNLRMEAKQKLAAARPRNLGQAARLAGVSPADLACLLIYAKAVEGRG